MKTLILSGYYFWKPIYSSTIVASPNLCVSRLAGPIRKGFQNSMKKFKRHTLLAIPLLVLTFVVTLSFPTLGQAHTAGTVVPVATPTSPASCGAPGHLLCTIFLANYAFHLRTTYISPAGQPVIGSTVEIGIPAPWCPVCNNPGDGTPSQKETTDQNLISAASSEGEIEASNLTIVEAPDNNPYTADEIYVAKVAASTFFPDSQVTLQPENTAPGTPAGPDTVDMTVTHPDGHTQDVEIKSINPGTNSTTQTHAQKVGQVVSEAFSANQQVRMTNPPTRPWDPNNVGPGGVIINLKNTPDLTVADFNNIVGRLIGIAKSSNVGLNIQDVWVFDSTGAWGHFSYLPGL